MLVMQNILYGLFGDPHRPIKNFFRKNTRSSAFLLGALFLGLTNTHAGHQKWKTIQSNINKSDFRAAFQGLSELPDANQHKNRLLQDCRSLFQEKTRAELESGKHLSKNDLILLKHLEADDARKIRCLHQLLILAQSDDQGMHDFLKGTAFEGVYHEILDGTALAKRNPKNTRALEGEIETLRASLVKSKKTICRE